MLRLKKQMIESTPISRLFGIGSFKKIYSHLWEVVRCVKEILFFVTGNMARFMDAAIIQNVDIPGM